MKDQRAYLLHVRDAVRQIRQYTVGGKRWFMSDRKTQDAVVRNIEIIGEASKNLSDGVKSKHREIPWKQVAGMRDKLIHEYFGVDLRLVWDTVKQDLPKLDRAIKAMLREPSMVSPRVKSPWPIRRDAP